MAVSKLSDSPVSLSILIPLKALPKNTAKVISLRQMLLYRLEALESGCLLECDLTETGLEVHYEVANKRDAKRAVLAIRSLLPKQSKVYTTFTSCLAI